jgi:transposase-like protein
MAINKIQFQKGLSLDEFLTQYGTETQCENAVVAMRWPHGYQCTRCACKRVSMTHNGRRLWECLSCGYQCSAIAGTIMESTKLPLRKWFLAMYFMTQNKNGISALELKRHVGVCYKTAWMLRHKLLEVMLQREAPRQLKGRVELDDAYLGGEKTGGKRGRGSENKVPFVAAVETNANGHPLYLRFDPVKSFKKEDIEAWAKQALMSSAIVVSDALAGFKGVADAGFAHESHVTGAGKQAAQNPKFRWVNTALGNLKMALSGTYHAFDFSKYAARYLAEFQYRFNRRFDTASMMPRLLFAMVNTFPQPLRKLRVSEVCH